MFSREAAENVADWMEGRKERGDDGGGGGGEERMVKNKDGWESVGSVKSETS